MGTQSSIRRLIVFLIIFFLFSGSNFTTFASASLESVRTIDIGKISSIDQLKAAINLLSNSLHHASKEHSLTPALQEQIVAKSGECISRLAELHERTKQTHSGNMQEEKDFILTNRDILKKILGLNTEIICEIQEKRLDHMQDPGAFFKTPEWRQPQHLIFLSSYWLGWNGYYASLLFSENDPQRKTLAKEAIEGFSRALIDFQTDAFIVKSLFGRGLCYKQILAYQNALNDFRSVRAKTNKENPLYWRCRFEEVLVTHKAGNVRQASQDLYGIEKEISGVKVPDEILTGLKELKSQVLFALSEKQSEKGQKEKENPAESSQRTFSELRELSLRNKGLIDELYHYAQKHPDELENLSYAELGPVASMALGDQHFDKRNYEKAATYYLPIVSDLKSPLKDRLDFLWFRLAYCHGKQGQWDKALPYLETSCNKFPKSSLIQQTVSLYYAAAHNLFETNPTPGNYKKFINSIQSYLRLCQTCPDRGEAHFQLGKYYQKIGQNEKASSEYLQVAKGSPNYPAARFLVLQSHIEALESVDNSGQGRSKDAEARYQKAVRLLEECRSPGFIRKGAAIQKEIVPQMIIIQAKLQRMGPTEACEKCVKTLEGFETRFPGEKPLFLEATCLRMECFLRLQLLKKAEEEIDEYIGRAPLDMAGYARLLALAERYYNHAGLIQGKDQEVPVNNQSTMAQIIYKKLYAISENNSSFNKYGKAIQLRLAQIYQNQDKWPLAIESYREILKKDPQDSDVLQSLAFLYEKTGQWEEALQIWIKFSQCLETGSSAWFESRYKTAYALQQLGRREKACSVLTMTLAGYPDPGDDILRKKYQELKSEVCNARSSHARKN
jgi:tetratricopeptide (TPR) repeat protein